MKKLLVNHIDPKTFSLSAEGMGESRQFSCESKLKANRLKAQLIKHFKKNGFTKVVHTGGNDQNPRIPKEFKKAVNCA